MSNRELSLFSYEILGLVGRTGASAHDLRRMVERGRMMAWAGESQYYVEPKRLAGLGYLATRKEPGKTRERTVYTLTPKGLEALREWGRTPVRFTAFKSELLMRLLVADLVGDADTVASTTALREELAELIDGLDEVEQSAEGLPHRAKYLHLSARMRRSLLELQLQWIDEIERELSPRQTPRGSSS